MKKIIEKFGIWIIIAAMFVSLIPSVTRRVGNEKQNNNVVLSLLYNDIKNKVSPVKLAEMMKEYKKLGVDTVSIMEDDVNSLVSRGELTCIKYNVLKHKYEDESIRIANLIAEKYPMVSYDSYLLMTKNDRTKEKLAEMIPLKYTSDEYIKIEGIENMDIYAFFDGREKLWNFTLGYDRDVIEKLKNDGFNIALIYKVKNYSKQDYIGYIEKIVKDYGVEYFNIKSYVRDYDKEDIIKANYNWIGEMINKNDMTLVVTENTDQLSNQKCLGHSKIFNTVMGKGGSKKVLRSYETYDDSQDDDTHYDYRVNQYFNSSVDRNIRFITVTQIAADGVTYDECADYTLKAVSEYMRRAKASGFEFGNEPSPFDYATKVRFPSACSAVIMILLVLKAIEMLFEFKNKKLTIAALVISVLAFGATFIMPLKLVLLYPTFYCLVISCFAMTVVMKACAYLGTKYKTVPEIFMIAALMLGILCIGALGMGAMLSGVDYYINNYIFRGIKLSLMVPLAYTAAAYYFASSKKNERENLGTAFKKMLLSDIKVYWVLIGGFIGMIGIYYIIRSGNVNKISSIEQAMRTAITNTFPARPRTKEFLIGYPSLVLFVYYMRNSKIKLVQWFFAVGTSILSASIMNSFCHVFTDLSVIYMRVVNGVLIGAVLSVFVYVANLVLVRIVKVLTHSVKISDSEMK